MSQHVMQIKLDGPNKGARAKSLYSNPDVFVRELIQNGHDAIAKRTVTSRDNNTSAPTGEDPNLHQSKMPTQSVSEITALV